MKQWPMLTNPDPEQTDFDRPDLARPGPAARTAALIVGTGLWLVCGLLVLSALGMADHFAAGWKNQYGWLGSPSPVLAVDLAVGQSLPRPPGPLEFISVRTATHLQNPTGRLELRLLRGPDAPKTVREMEQRTIRYKTVAGQTVKDNFAWRWNFPRADYGSGLYLLARRLTKPTSPISLWLDRAGAWPGPSAEVLRLDDRGKVTAQPASGHLTLILGSRPTLANLVQRRPVWLAAWGLIWLGLGLWRLRRGDPARLARRFDRFRGNKRPIRALYYLLLLAGAAAFTFWYFQATDEYYQADLTALTHFEADTPFQYRLLIPYLAQTVLFYWEPVVRFLSGGVINCDRTPDLIRIYFVITTCSIYGLVLAMRAYLSLSLTRRWASWSALLVFYPLYWNYCRLSEHYYAYDMSAMALFTLALYLILTERWKLFYAVFLVAAVNRDTSAFISVAFLVLTLRRDRLAWVCGQIALQAALWLAIKLGIQMLFAGNGGQGAFEIHWPETRGIVGDLLRGRFHERPMRLLSSYGWLWTLLPLTVWKAPRHMKKLLLLVPPFYAIMAVVAVFDEIRIYNEMVPLILGPVVVGGRRLAEAVSGKYWPADRSGP